MSTNMPHRDQPPPPLDEGYWSALLREGEYAESSPEETDIVANVAPIEDDENTQPQPTPPPIAALADWQAIDMLMQNDEVIELLVSGYNRGGILVEWRSLHGFVPASQLTGYPATANGNFRRNWLQDLIGKTLKLRVIELNRDQNRLILSERAARVQAGERAGILHRLQPGDSVSGIITNICDFGAFVDLGGLEGLIHISELSWGRVAHPSDILERGQSVHVHVLEIERQAGRIALSLKRLHPDPWVTITERYKIGQLVEGEITNVVDFGAFACIEDGLEGLIHVSELAEGHFLHPRNVVCEGQHVTARVLSIDSRARRLGLSLRLQP